MTHKLLLADDSITIQRVIELTFADEDVQVLAVGDGQKAIASIQSDRPDIVLADVGMPERDGYEVAEFVKSNPQLASIPVLLLTGAFEPIDETRARAVGCDGVLVKPFEPQMVINRVKDLLAGRRSGGLWGNKTAPSPDTPAPPAQVQPAAPESSAASASLEDYFDRLDAAFASVEAASEGHGLATAARSANAAPPVETKTGSSGLAKHDLEGWDPDLTGDPVRPRAVPIAPVPVAPPVVRPPTAESPATVAPASPPPAAIPPTSTPTIRFKPVAPPPSEPPTAPVPQSTAPAPPARTASIPFVAPVPAPRAVVEPPPVVAEPPSAPVVEHRGPVPAPVVAPVPTPVAAPPAASTVNSSPTSSPSSLSSSPSPSLAEAFAALLSAEQGRAISASKVGASNVSEQTIDDIVKRVITRMTDQSVRDTVLDVAERLVREEIDRIKGQ